MGHSPKSRVRDLLGGVPVRAAAHKGRSRRAGMVMLWLAAAVAITGVYQLESMYDLAGLRAWRTRGAKDAAAARAGSAAPSARAAFEPAAGVGAGADADPGPDAADSLAPAAAAPAYDGTFVYQAAGAGAAARGAPAESEETGAAINAAPRAAAQPAPAAAAEPARKQAIPPRALLLASHSRLVWYDPETDESTILHEGGGVHYGMFPGEGSPPTTVWTAVRPHNWRPATTQEHLVEIDMRTGAEVRRVEIPSRFTHDVVRAGDRVYVCDTGNGRLLEYEFPSMMLLRAMPLFSLKDHANTLAPFRPNETLVVLHKLGMSDVVRVDVSRDPPQVIGRLQGVGKKAHGLVRWHGAYIILDSDNGALISLRVGPGGAKIQWLWKAPEPNRFLKGLTVVDDVAYFGISEWAPRDARDDPRSNCQLAAFDLVHSKLLWRREVPTAGLLNIVGAPQLAADSTYVASYTSKRSRRYKTAKSGEVVAAAALAQEAMGYSPVVGGYWSSGLPYLDATVKATPTPWTGGLQVPLAHLDVSEAKALLRSLPPAVWTHEYQAAHSAVMGGRDSNMNAFKPGVMGITLLFSAGSGEGTVFKFPLYEKFAPVLEPLLEEMIGAPDMANIIRLQLALMSPNVSDIRIHVDTGGYATHAHRLHIPLMTNPGVSFDLCPFLDDAKTQQVCHKVPTGEGFAFELNNKVPHRVSNSGATDRVHVVVDIAESPRARVRLAPGTVCHYDVNKGMFCGDDAPPAANAAQQQALLLQQQRAQAAAAAAQQQAQQQALLARQQAAGAARAPAQFAAAPVGQVAFERPAVSDDDPRFRAALQKARAGAQGGASAEALEQRVEAQLRELLAARQGAQAGAA